MVEDEPNLVSSSKCQEVTIDGYPFSIEIYRLEVGKTWAHEVVDHEGTSHVWDDQFKSENDALDEAIKDLNAEGAVAFIRGDNVIPFR